MTVPGNARSDGSGAAAMWRSTAKKILGPRLSAGLKFRASLAAYSRNYLQQKVWHKTVYGVQSVNNQGPIPYITYPALMMLERIMLPTQRAFEYGCGNSSLWWSQKVSSIVAVEHNELWASRIRRHAPPNLTVTLKRINDVADPELSRCAVEFFRSAPELPTSGNPLHDLENGMLNKEFIAYAVELARYGKGYFDVVVIDGMCRSLSAFVAANFVKDDGIILFDDSQRWQYNAGYDAIAARGFKRIDFYGTGPIATHEWCTSIFCRNLTWIGDNGRVPRWQQNDLGW